MRIRYSMLLLIGLFLVSATGCHGRFFRRSCGSATRADLPPVPADYCPNP